MKYVGLLARFLCKKELKGLCVWSEGSVLKGRISGSEGFAGAGRACFLSRKLMEDPAVWIRTLNLVEEFDYLITIIGLYVSMIVYCLPCNGNSI